MKKKLKTKNKKSTISKMFKEQERKLKHGEN